MAVDRRLVLGGLAAAVAPAIISLKASPPAAADVPSVLVAEPGKLALVAKAQTTVLAYNGQVPGPLLRVRKGEAVAVRLANKLDRPTTICWHGVRLPDAMDGVAGLTQAAVRAGDTFDYRFTPPDSGLFWYHPDVWPSSAGQVDRGLYGVLIVDEPVPPPVDEDLLVVLDDWVLGPDGQIRDEPPGASPLAALLTANSQPAPLQRTYRPGARVRLRLLNASGSRLAVASCVGVTVTVIAVDGQPSELFEPARGTVPIGPGSRFELILDLPRQPAEAAVIVKSAGLPDQPLLHLTAAGRALDPRGPVVKLPENPLLPTRIHLEKSLKRDLVIVEAASANLAAKPGAAQPSRESALAWTLAGKPVDGLAGRPFFSVKRGAPVTLAFSNRTPYAQQAHIHGHVFRVLHDLDDGWDPYWRESVLLAPGKTKHVAFVADNPGRWKVEALALDRPGASLASYFTVEPAS